MLKPSSIVQKGLVASLFSKAMRRRGYKITQNGKPVTSPYAMYLMLLDIHDFLLATSATAGQCNLPDAGQYEFVPSKRSENRSLFRFRIASVLDDFIRKSPGIVNTTETVDTETLDEEIEKVMKKIEEWRDKRHAGFVSPSERKFL